MSSREYNPVVEGCETPVECGRQGCMYPTTCPKRPNRNFGMPNPIMKYFQFEHLNGIPRNVSRECAQLAEHINNLLPDGPEKSAGLRKLLEAKDCFVRASLEY